MRNQASWVKSGDTLINVLMCGIALLLPVAFACQRLRRNTKIKFALFIFVEMLNYHLLGSVSEHLNTSVWGKVQVIDLLEVGVQPELFLSRLDAVGKRASRWKTKGCT